MKTLVEAIQTIAGRHEPTHFMWSGDQSFRYRFTSARLEAQIGWQIVSMLVRESII